jgi:hypothetical protein
MAVALLDLVETALRVAKQALGKRAGKPESGGLAREAHIVAHCIHKEEGHTYPELVDRMSLMPAVCERLGLNPDAPPDPTTFYHSFDRYAMYIWRALLRISAQQHPQSGHVALDSTFFEREQASQHYLQRCGRSVRTIKAATLTDTESLAVLDVHCCIEREHDTKLKRMLLETSSSPNRIHQLFYSGRQFYQFHQSQLIGPYLPPETIGVGDGQRDSSHHPQASRRPNSAYRSRRRWGADRGSDVLHSRRAPEYRCQSHNGRGRRIAHRRWRGTADTYRSVVSS